MKYLTLLVTALTLTSLIFAFPTKTMEFNFNTTVKYVDHNKHHNTTELLRLALDHTRKRQQWLQKAATHSSPINVGAPNNRYNDYIAYLSIGTPQVSFPALLDTAGALTWTQCTPCHKCTAQSTPLFNPKNSNSYVTLKCPNNKCKLLNNKGCHKLPSGTKCTFNITYGDGTVGSRGDLATETFWLGSEEVPGVLFGCAFNSQGDVLGGGAGNLGLGRWKETLVSQLNVRAFSYCLPTYGSNETGHLFLGCGARAPPGALTTPLYRYEGLFGGFYPLNLQWIAINGVRIHINSSAFEVRKDGLAGMIIDTGTLTTYLERSMYEAVGRVLDRQIGLRRTKGYLDFCYKLPRGRVDGKQLPQIVFGFEGAALKLPWQNSYFIEESTRTVCLFMATSDYLPYSIFGSFQQQNILVVYDLDNEKLSFVQNTV